MNEDTLKEFILQNSTRILLCGLSCIGKTHFKHFLKSQGLYHLISKISSCNKFYPESRLNEKIVVQLSGEHKGAIIIGAPWGIWKERRLLRRVYHRGSRFAADPVAFKETYIKCINKLEEYNIPHIFIDNRNDCPILDKTSFLTMITEESYE